MHVGQHLTGLDRLSAFRAADHAHGMIDLSSFVRRPPPSSSERLPIGSAARRVTIPRRGARTSVTTGARGSASRSGSPPCARIQRS
jgi:hypothetical protein